MKSYRSNTLGDFLAGNNAGTYTPILAVLGSILIFTLLYSIVGRMENETAALMTLSIFSLCSGILLNKVFSNTGEKKKQNDVYRQLLDRDSDVLQMVYKVKDDGFVYVSNNIQDILGYRAAEISVPFFQSCLSKKDFESWGQLLDLDYLQKNKTLSLDFRTTSKYGVIRWMEWTAKAVLDYGGNIDFVLINVKDISNRVETLQADKLYLRELEKVVKQNSRVQSKKNSLLDLISLHDLKEPLRSIKSYIQLINKRFASNLGDTGKEFVNYAAEGIDRLQEMIDDIIAYTQMEHETTSLKEVDPNSIIEKVKKNLGYKIFEKNACIHVGPLPNVIADGAQMEHLLRNLLDNALTYVAGRVPNVEISCSKKEQSWQFAVKDNGIGIKDVFKEGVFEMFHQLHSGDQYGGTRVGLAICKKIIDNHSGKIWVESEGEGKGSVFYFTIPIIPETASAKDGESEEAGDWIQVLRDRQKLETI